MSHRFSQNHTLVKHAASGCLLLTFIPATHSWKKWQPIDLTLASLQRDQSTCVIFMAKTKKVIGLLPRLNCALQKLVSTLSKPFMWILPLQGITLSLCNGRLPCFPLKIWWTFFPRYQGLRIAVRQFLALMWWHHHSSVITVLYLSRIQHRYHDNRKRTVHSLIIWCHCQISNPSSIGLQENCSVPRNNCDLVNYLSVWQSKLSFW